MVAGTVGHQVGDPDLGFSGLRRYGMGLINHLTMKVRSSTEAGAVMLVDSPGMIDSPTGDHERQALDQDWFPASLGVRGAEAYRTDRGYDFYGVTRWMAERADVVLLFFDPDKPGTTGETLTCLTQSLHGMEHKLHIILNKADQFQTIHDFARAYGSLCWNLSKVIPRKDLPRIYTMCTPVQSSLSPPSAALALAGDDLDRARNEVVGHLKSAPARRIDNLVTKLYDSARLLLMHGRMADAVQRANRRVTWRQWSTTGGIFGAGQLLAAMGLSMEVWEFSLGISSVALVLATGNHLLSSKQVQRERDAILSDEGMARLLREEYHLQLAAGDEFVISLWERVRPQLRVAVTTFGVKNMPMPSSSELSRLQSIVDSEVPALRRITAAQIDQPNSEV